MRVNFRGSVTVAAALLFTMSLATRAQAAIIEFDDLIHHGGTVVKSGTTITGTNVVFDVITFEDGADILAAAQCGATAADASCVLNFTFDTVTSTGTITMTTLSGLYDAGADKLPFTADDGALFQAAGTTVLDGVLTSALFGPTGFIGDGSDAKSAELLDFFGITAFGDFTFTNTEIKTTRGLVTDADLVNSGDIEFIPEPGVLSLFGLGLLAVGRRFKRAAK